MRLGDKSGISGLDVLLATVDQSRHVVYAEDDGTPLALAGVVDSGTTMAPLGALWMAITPEVRKYRKAFLRLTREYVENWSRDYAALVDYIPEGREDTLRWLHWLGFEIMMPVPNNVGGRSHPVEYRAWA